MILRSIRYELLFTQWCYIGVYLMSEPVEQKKPAMEDWHRADIIAELHKRGWSMRQLSFANGYSNGCALKTALDRPWPKGERMIAEALGLSPEEIWPSRYQARQIKKVYHTKKVA